MVDRVAPKLCVYGHIHEGRGQWTRRATTLVNAAAVDTAIAAALDRDWPLAKLDPVLRALLRAACGELAGGPAPPARVVINEYLDIARGFFTGPEPGLANAVLDRLARTLRASEF